MSKYKDRVAKEAPYMIHNKDFSSVCEGTFYIKGRNIHEECKNRDKCQKYAKYKDSHMDLPMVGFRYVDTFRKCDLWKYKAIDGAYALQIAIYNMIYVNDLACACVIDMKDKLQEQDKETKKIFGALVKRQVVYEKEITRIVGNKIDFCAEYNSQMDEKIKSLVQDLYDAIYNFLNKNGVENCTFIALAELCYTITSYSVNSIEKRISECLKYSQDILNLRSYKLSEMEKISRNLCNWLCRKIKDMDMNKDENIINAYRKLDKALTNVGNIDCSILKATENAI